MSSLTLEGQLRAQRRPQQVRLPEKPQTNQTRAKLHSHNSATCAARPRNRQIRSPLGRITITLAVALTTFAMGSVLLPKSKPDCIGIRTIRREIITWNSSKIIGPGDLDIRNSFTCIPSKASQLRSSPEEVPEPPLRPLRMRPSDALMLTADFIRVNRLTKGEPQLLRNPPPPAPALQLLPRPALRQLRLQRRSLRHTNPVQEMRQQPRMLRQMLSTSVC